VVGHQAQGHIGPLVRPVGDAAGGGRRADDRREEVGVEDRGMPLQDGQNPLEAGPGVDVLLGQLGPGAVGRPVELHEDQVPDLHVAVLVAELRAAPLAVLGAHVEEDLRVRSARAGVAHGPEVVVVPHALDPLGREAHLGDPYLLGLVVAVVDRDPQALGVQTEDVGQQPPGHGDGVFLEVVAEAEVAQHLEEGAVVGVRADDLDIERAEALLHAGGPRPGRRLIADEVGLEGDHAGDGEQHRGVVGDEAGGGDRGVAPLGEVPREGRPQFVGVHLDSLPASTWADGRGRPGGQLAAMPTMGLLRCRAPVEP
jgi:hypothetical protein